METLDSVAIRSRRRRPTAKRSLTGVLLGTAPAQRAEAHTRVELTRATIELRQRLHR
jgi:hypothetical protein